MMDTSEERFETDEEMIEKAEDGELDASELAEPAAATAEVVLPMVSQSAAVPPAHTIAAAEAVSDESEGELGLADPEAPAGATDRSRDGDMCEPGAAGDAACPEAEQAPAADLEEGELEDGELEDDEDEEPPSAPADTKDAGSGDEDLLSSPSTWAQHDSKPKRKSLLRPGELYEPPSAGARQPLPPLEDEYADYEAGLGAPAGHGRFSKRRRTERGHKSPAICSYYMQGKCQKGRNCQFSHNAIPPRKMELCKFYLMDCCAKKEKCLYLHKGFPCKFFQTGANCFTDEKCKFSHEPLNDITRSILLKHLETAPKEILGDFPRMTRSDAIHRIELAAEKREKGEEPNFTFPNFEQTREPHLVKNTFDPRNLENDRPMQSRDRPKWSSPECGERAGWGSPEVTERAGESVERGDRADTEREERPVRGERPERHNRDDRQERGEKRDRARSPERPDRRSDRGDAAADRQDRSERGDRQDRSERSDRQDRSERGERQDRSERGGTSEDEQLARRDRRQRRGADRRQREERRRRRYERGSAERDRSPRRDRHGDRRRRRDERRGARNSPDRELDPEAEKDRELPDMEEQAMKEASVEPNQSTGQDESETSDKLNIDEGEDGKRSPDDEDAHAEDGHAETDDPLADRGLGTANMDFINSLPASQRKLYLRIHQQQKELVPREDTPQPTADDDDRAADDNWYSSDEEDAPPLAAVLKKISAEPAKPGGGPELAAPKPVMPTIDPADAINQLLTSIRKNTAEQNRSTGAGEPRAGSPDSGRPRRDSWSDRDRDMREKEHERDRDERRRRRPESRTRQRRGSWQRRSGSSDEQDWRARRRDNSDSPPARRRPPSDEEPRAGRPRRDEARDARNARDADVRGGRGFPDVDSRDRRPARAADTRDPRSQGDLDLWEQRQPRSADNRDARELDSGAARDANPWDPSGAQDVDARDSRATVREVDSRDPRAALRHLDIRDPRAAGDGWQVADTSRDPRAAARDVDSRDPRAAVRDVDSRDPRSAARDLESRDPRAAARELDSRDPRARVSNPRLTGAGSPSADVDLRRPAPVPPPGWPDTDLRVQDTDLRVQDRDMRAMPAGGPPPQRLGWDIGTMDFDKDVNDLPLPFKPVDIKPCVEIDASVNSHPPMEWVVVHVTVERLDYSIHRYRVTEPQARVDPRIKSARRRSSQEEQPRSARVIPTEPSREYEQLMAAGQEPRDEPRYRPDPRAPVDARPASTDPRRAAAAMPPPLLNVAPPGMMPMPAMSRAMAMYPGMGPPPPTVSKPGLLGMMPGVPGSVPPMMPGMFPPRASMPPPMPGYGRHYGD